MRNTAVSGLLAAILLSAAVQADCTPEYHYEECEDDEGNSSVNTYTIYPTGCPTATAWANWAASPTSAPVWSSVNPIATWTAWSSASSPSPWATWSSAEPTSTWADWSSAEPTSTWADWSSAEPTSTWGDWSSASSSGKSVWAAQSATSTWSTWATAAVASPKSSQVSPASAWSNVATTTTGPIAAYSGNSAPESRVGSRAGNVLAAAAIMGMLAL